MAYLDLYGFILSALKKTGKRTSDQNKNEINKNVRLVGNVKLSQLLEKIYKCEFTYCLFSHHFLPVVQKDNTTLKTHARGCYHMVIWLPSYSIEPLLKVALIVPAMRGSQRHRFESHFLRLKGSRTHLSHQSVAVSPCNDTDRKKGPMCRRIDMIAGESNLFTRELLAVMVNTNAI